MKLTLSDTEIDKIAKKAQKVAKGNYKRAESMAKNNATLQALQIKVDTELIKTIRHPDIKNLRLQRLLFWLSVIGALATLLALIR